MVPHAWCSRSPYLRAPNVPTLGMGQGADAGEPGSPGRRPGLALVLSRPGYAAARRTRIARRVTHLLGSPWRSKSTHVLPL